MKNFHHNNANFITKKNKNASSLASKWPTTNEPTQTDLILLIVRREIKMVAVQPDLRSVIQIAATVCYLNPSRFDSRPDRRVFVRTPPASLKRLCVTNAVVKTVEKPSICTADELHYVSVHNSDWRLALWRYKPLPKVPPFSLLPTTVLYM